MAYLEMGMLGVFAVLFFKVAEIEKLSGPLWATVSAVCFVGTWIGLGLGWLGCLAGQLGLFVGLGIVKAIRKP